MDELHDPIPCPECGSYVVQPIDEPDEENLVEYLCVDCGYYFVDAA